MNLKEALEKVEKLRDGYKEIMENNEGTSERPKQMQQLIELYGELEEVIGNFCGIRSISVPTHGQITATYPNYIAAGLLASRTFFRYEGYTQLCQLVGKIREYAKDPSVPIVEHNLTSLIQILRRFRECCQYSQPPKGEREVQTLLWTILRSNFERIEREEVLQRFGSKQYRPDFGIPDLGVLIEVKFLGEKSTSGEIQDQILGDVPGYLTEAARYQSIVVFIYDDGQKLRDPKNFIEDLKKVSGIVEVIVIPGFG